jgi:hypothetical protein
MFLEGMNLTTSDILKIVRNLFEVYVNVYNCDILFILSSWLCDKSSIKFVCCYPYISSPNIHENLLLFIK